MDETLAEQLKREEKECIEHTKYLEGLLIKAMIGDRNNG